MRLKHNTFYIIIRSCDFKINPFIPNATLTRINFSIHHKIQYYCFVHRTHMLSKTDSKEYIYNFQFVVKLVHGIIINMKFSWHLKKDMWKFCFCDSNKILFCSYTYSIYPFAYLIIIFFII